MRFLLLPRATRSSSLGQLRLLTALLCVVVTGPVVAGASWPDAESDALQVAFGSDPLSGNWIAEQGDEACVLIQAIRGYGEARFARAGVGAPVFELLALRPHFDDGAIELVSVAPSWHRAHPQQHLLAQLTADDDGALRLTGTLVLQMLMQLRDGRQLSFRQQQPASRAEAVSVDVSPLHLRPVYGMLSGCGSVTADRAEARESSSAEPLVETLVYFDVDSSRLLPDSLAELAALVTEIEARLADDASPLQRIRIEGHTDSTGTERHNEGLSLRRAEAVADVLRLAGVDDALLEFSHHAARRPAASNDTPEDRQRNRRTRVHLD